VGVTKIGSPDANIPQDIQLVGAHIASEHCVFQNMDGVVSLTPQPGALCYVNGRKVSTIFLYADKFSIFKLEMWPTSV
jgi:kinesin family protein 1